MPSLSTSVCPSIRICNPFLNSCLPGFRNGLRKYAILLANNLTLPFCTELHPSCCYRKFNPTVLHRAMGISSKMVLRISYKKCSRNLGFLLYIVIKTYPLPSVRQNLQSISEPSLGSELVWFSTKKCLEC